MYSSFHELLKSGPVTRECEEEKAASEGSGDGSRPKATVSEGGVVRVQKTQGAAATPQLLVSGAGSQMRRARGQGSQSFAVSGINK